MSDKISSKVVVKSGIWYTVSNFIFRSIAFLTTPIFARILSKAEYGEYNNINSWISLLVIIATCDLHTSIIRAKLDYEDDLERYSFSVLTLSSIITIILYFIFCIFAVNLENLLGFDSKYFGIIFLYLLFQEAYQVFITLERAHYRYKAFSLITGLSIVIVYLFSLFLVLTLNNKLDARIYGQYIPYVIIGLIMYVLLIKKGKKISFKYYGYALSLSLPLVPHLLSIVALNSSDRIMITKLVGAQYTAIYSIAYIIMNIVTVLLDSMNKAWAPWLLDSLKVNNKADIRNTSTPYFVIFLGLLFGVLLFGPEIVWILGGNKYLDGIYVLPPLLVGCLYQFAYTMYVQLEFFEKKMKTVAVGTMIAALVNIGLNFIFIPIFGYVAAAYTTLVGYILLFIIHYRTICRYGYKNIFNRKIIFGALGSSIFMLPIFILLYMNVLVRYVVIIVYVGIIFYLIIKYNKIIKSEIREKRLMK